MITEDYVSFKLAKLLKKKGFDEPCECLYDTENNDVSIVCAWVETSNSKLEEREFVRYSALTLQMTMKWLRKENKLHIIVEPYPHEDNCFYWAYKILFLDKNNLKVSKVSQKAGFDTDEQACEAAITDCLKNLI